MPDVRDDRKYHEGHGWVMEEEEGVARFGITDFAQDELTEVLLVEAPKVGTKVTQGVSMGEIESLKVISDLIAPASGEVVEVNDGVRSDPSLVNREPYDGGWLIRVRLDDQSELDRLLDAAGYAARTE